MAECDLTVLQQQMPCLQCLTKSEKDAAIAYLLALSYITLNRSGQDLTSLRQSVMCFDCEPESRLDDFMVQIMMNLAVDIGALDAAMTAEELRHTLRCWQCGIGSKELKSITVMAMCGVLEILGEAYSVPQ